MRVEQFYNKNQFIIYGEGKTIFQSYNSTIAIINNNQLKLGYDWDYSNTTRKHLYLFLEDYLYLLSDELKEHIKKALQSKNKKASIQLLINNNKIVYDEALR